MLLHQFVRFGGETVALILQLFVQLQLVLIHLRLQLVFQAHQLLLVLPPHALVPRHLLPQGGALLVLLDLTGYLEEKDVRMAPARPRSTADATFSTGRKDLMINLTREAVRMVAKWSRLR